jgi:aspartokinase-like uncharacterized kinase
VKIGGRLLAHPEHLDATLAALAGVAKEVPMLVVPGGGAFADAIRDADRRLGLSDEAAHWMAVLAMDQYAHLIASRMSNARLVVRKTDAAAALQDGRIPVLAPYQWLREADPLPHSWDVTSDSISAWVAGQIGATRLVLVKPPGAAGDAIVDPCFDRFLPAHVTAGIITAERIGELSAMLRLV